MVGAFDAGIAEGRQVAGDVLRRRRNVAVEKALDALGRYKFEMFGYWASAAVRYSQTLGDLGQQPWQDGNPFRELVLAARSMPVGLECGSCTRGKVG